MSILKRAWLVPALMMLCHPVAGQPASSEPAVSRSLIHACTAQDLAGTYVMVGFQETPKGSESAWNKQFPYQYLTFYPAQGYATVGLMREQKVPSMLNRFLLGQYQHAKGKWALINDMLVLQEKKQMNFHCQAVPADTDGYKKGDLILTGYGDKSESELYKLYRRWY